MSFLKEEHKGQVIKIKKTENGFGYDLFCFPKNRKSTSKYLMGQKEFASEKDAMDDAKERIDLEFERGNWEMPREPIKGISLGD